MSQEQSQYILEQVLFTTERFPDETFDIAKSVVELNIYEDMERPYLTASIAMMDDVAFKSSVGIKGSERIVITLKATKDDIGITKTFMVTGISSEVSVNERTDVRTLTLVEEHAYLSFIQKISQTYEGHPEDIIKNILQGHLDKQFDVLDSQIAVQKRMRVIVPNMQPLEAIDWIRDRMAYANGSPYFTYAVLRSDGIQLSDLGSLMQSEPWNKDNEYTYAQTSHNTSLDEEDSLRKLFHVKSYKASRIESTLRIAQGGALGSSFAVRDLTSSFANNDAFQNSTATLNQFVEDLGYTEESSIGFDDQLVIGTPNKGEVPVGNYQSKIFSQIVASRMFFDDNNKPVPSYHDELEQSANHNLKIKSAALRSILLNNVFTIGVPGQPYLLNPDAGCGSTIKLNYAEPTVDENRIEQLDKNRSGKFLVYKTRHKFVDGIYDVHMDIVKLTDNKE